MPRATGSLFRGDLSIKPYRRQGVVFALVKTIKRDPQEQGTTELCSSAHIENTLSHSAHQSWGLDETDRVVFFEHRWFEKAVDAKKPAPLMQVQD